MLIFYNATSGAAPYGAGAAALLFDRFYRPSPLHWTLFVEPGTVYASLIALGDQDTATSFQPENGAGHVRLPTPGRSRLMVGKRTLNNSDRNQVVNFNVDFSGFGLEVGIWWPDERNRETGNYIHQPVQITLKDPKGNVVAHSKDPRTVFHRFEVPKLLIPGQWELIFQAIPNSTHQPIYYAIHRSSVPVITYPSDGIYWKNLISQFNNVSYYPLKPLDTPCP